MDVDSCVSPLESALPAQLPGHADGTDRRAVSGSGRPAGMSDGHPDSPIVNRSITECKMDVAHSHGCVVQGLLKTQALPAAPNATVGYTSPDWLGVSKPRRAAPAAAVIASGGACDGLFVPRVASFFQKPRPCRRPSMPPSDMPLWTGLASQNPAERRLRRP